MGCGEQARGEASHLINIQRNTYIYILSVFICIWISLLYNLCLCICFVTWVIFNKPFKFKLTTILVNFLTKVMDKITYVIVEFSGGNNSVRQGEVAIVKKSWLTPLKTEVFWPPYKTDTQYMKTLKCAEEVNTDTWTLYPISRCFYETDNIDKAIKKLKVVECTSDLGSDSGSNLGKRKRLPPRRLSYDSDETNIESDILLVGGKCSQSQLPRPPKVSFVSRPLESQHQEDIGTQHNETYYTQNNSICFQNPKYIGKIVNKDSIQSNILLEKGLQSEKPPHTIVSEIQNQEDIDELCNDINYIQNNKKNSRNNDSICVQVNNSSFESAQSQHNANSINRQMLLLLHTVKEQNDQILKYLEKKQKNTHSLPENFPFVLPLKSDDELVSFEDFLGDKHQSLALESYLSSLGGKDCIAKTNKILKTILSDQLVQNYSFYGQRSKKAFYLLKLKNIVIDSVKKSLPDSNNQEIEDSIKVWLKHAPQRIQRQSASCRNKNM